MYKELYPGLAKIAEGQSFSAENILNTLGDYKHLLIPGAIGAAGGGLAGLGVTGMQHPERERHFIRNILLGMLTGGAIGTGAGHFRPQLGDEIQEHASRYMPSFDAKDTTSEPTGEET